MSQETHIWGGGSNQKGHWGPLSAYNLARTLHTRPETMTEISEHKFPGKVSSWAGNRNSVDRPCKETRWVNVLRQNHVQINVSLNASNNRAQTCRLVSFWRPIPNAFWRCVKRKYKENSMRSFTNERFCKKKSVPKSFTQPQCLTSPHLGLWTPDAFEDTPFTHGHLPNVPNRCFWRTKQLPQA